MKAKEIEEKYKIMVLLPNTMQMSDECGLICACGHHAKYHKGDGTAGYCSKCGRIEGACHNFNAAYPTKILQLKKITNDSEVLK